MKTRREFIQQGLLSGAALAVSSACQFGREESVRIDPGALERLRSALSGFLILPSDKQYDAARSVFWKNPHTDRRPIAVARCAGPDDVMRCIELAAEQRLPLAVRAGGHSFLGWGTCDDGLIIDTTLMNDISIDASVRTARLGGGVITQDLAAAAGEHGLAAAQGTCPLVGVSGLTLGGGLGWLSGMHGAACDNLISAELVTADGRRLRASAEENPDLFWAIRGGGGNFGVVTSLTTRLHAIREVVAGRVSYRPADVGTVLRYFREYMEGSPEEIQAVAFVRPEGDALAHIAVCWAGEPGEEDEFIRPLRTVAKPVADTIERRPYATAFGLTGVVPRSFSTVKGSYLESLTDAFIDTVLDRIAGAAGIGPAIGMDHYTHGAVCRVAPEATAFAHRAPGTVHVWINTGWNDPADAAAGTKWVDETWAALQPFSGGRVYANFPGAEGPEASRGAYAGNYARLAALKRRFDPANLFRQNQNIPSA